MPKNEISTKSVFAAIVGRTNVGKSSLLNAILGRKVAIVSPKPQTTRTRINGVKTSGEVQVVFVDTPGMHRPKTRLGDYMLKTVAESVSGVDVCVFVAEPEGELTPQERKLLDDIASSKMPVILAINKIDTLPKKERILERIAELSALYKFDAVVPLSAMTGEGVGTLVDEIIPFAVEGPHYFDGDTVTDMPEKVIASEILREKLLLNLEQEIPHGTAVVVESMKERESSDILDVEAVIYCERESHKGIIIGKGGAKLKAVASAARLDMEGFFGIKVNLKCWVKVKEDWRNRENYLRSFGFDQ